MSVPSSVEELLQLIRKSGMIDDQKFNAYLQRRQIGRGALPHDPRDASDVLVQDGIITEFQKEQFLLGKWRGFTIGKYKLLERVGVGGMGQVFLCEHLYMKRRVAIKVLPPNKAEQPAALGRFYREARAAGSLEHPNIVRTHDIDQDGNLHFIVMEYVDGANLLDIVKKFGPMDVRRAVDYIRQAASGLEYAFKSGLIHRDVKPGNILLDRQGKAKVLDMGLARFYNDHTDNLTVKYDDKIVLGTADYVAPEQVANSHNVDVRADIYALGASLYFLLAGHPPFPQGTVSQKLLWHRTKDPTPIRQVRPEVPEGLAAVLQKMMQKDPAQRYQTPGEVQAELGKWASATVPLPPAVEMPVLCVAAQEALAQDQSDSAPVPQAAAERPKSVPSFAGSASASSSSAARPFAPPAGGNGQFAPPPASPFGVGSNGFGGATSVRDLAQSRSGTLSAPTRSPRANPFGSQADVNTHGGIAAQDPTPANVRAPQHRSAGFEPAVPKPVASPIQRYALIVILSVCAVLGGLMLYSKFGDAGQPPAATANP